MTLAPSAIHDALADFFVSQFGANGSGPVVFRFDRFGSILSETDFLDPHDPTNGPSETIATEVASDLVNRIPVDDGDGVNVTLTDGEIDDVYYYRLLGPAQAQPAADLADGDRQAAVDAFNALKADAVRIFETTKLESSSGLVSGEYHPSATSPKRWFDATVPDLWTRHSLVVSEPALPPAAGGGPTGIWRLKPTDATMSAVLRLSPAGAPQLDLASQVSVLRTAPLPAVTALARVAPPVAAVAPVRAASLMQLPQRPPVDRGPGPVVLRPIPVVPPPATGVYDAYETQLQRLPIGDRILVNTTVGGSAPQQPAGVNSISIAFDYCLVHVERPWYTRTFVDETGWCVPGTAKGALSAAGTPGSLSAMPVGFVAVRGLAIEAQWSASDVAAASAASAFGPFRIESQVQNGKLEIGFDGIQIVGWLLEQMPLLPPQ